MATTTIAENDLDAPSIRRPEASETYP